MRENLRERERYIKRRIDNLQVLIGGSVGVVAGDIATSYLLDIIELIG